MAARECYVAMLEMDKQLTTMNIEEQRVDVELMEELQDISLDKEHPDRITCIDMHASPLVQNKLILFLKNNLDLYAWSHKDMSRIDPKIMVHQLNVSPSFPPVQQRKRIFAQEMDKAMAKEVHKLLDAGFIRKVYYSEWLANVVMVKNANRKWRMCVDFTNLNKAYLKDCYPLP